MACPFFPLRQSRNLSGESDVLQIFGRIGVTHSYERTPRNPGDDFYDDRDRGIVLIGEVVANGRFTAAKLQSIRERADVIWM